MKNKFHISFYLITLLTMFVLVVTTATAQRFAVATGNWSGAIWATTTGGVAGSAATPTSADAVTINAGVTVTVDVAASCASLTFTAGAPNTATTSTINGTNSLTITGALTINGQNGTTAGTPNNMAVGAGTLSAGSVVPAGVSGSASKFAQITISTGTVTVTGNITSDGSECRITFSDIGILYAGGTFLSGTQGTFTASTGTVNFNAAGAQAIAPFAYTFNNVTLSGSGVKTTTNATINGMLSMEGTATASAAPTYGAAATLQYNTATARTAGVEWITPFTGTGGVIIANTGTITLNGNKSFTACPLTVKEGSTLAAGTRTMGGTLNALNLVCGGLTAGSTISGTGLLTLGGNVSVIDAGNGTFGATVSCPVALTAATTRTFTVADDGTAAIDLTMSGIISTTGSLIKAGAGTMRLSAANTYSGTTTINAGTLQNGITNALGSGAVTVNDGGTCDLNGFSDAIGGVLAVNSGVVGGTVTTSAGILTLGGNVTSTGGAANATISGNLALGANRTFTLTNAADGMTVSAVISGAFNLTKAGAGVLTLSGTNSFSGAVTINAGILSVNTLQNAGTNSSLGTGSGTPAISIAATGTLQYTGTGSSTSRAIALTGSGATIDASGSGTLILSGGVTGNTRNLNLIGTGAGIESGVIATTSGTVTKNGTGTWALSGANTYTGITTVTAGTLSYNSIQNVSGGASALGAPTTVANGTIAVGATGILQYTGSGHSSNRVVNLSASGGTIDASGSGTLTLSGGVTGNARNLNLIGTGAGIESGVIATTSGTVTKDGTGAWTLSGTNTFSGGATLSAGTLNIGNLQALGTVAGTFTINGGTIDATAAFTTLNYPQAWNGDFAFTGSNTLNLGTGAVTLSADRQVTVNGSTLTVGGTINDNTKSLTKAGAGTLSFGSNPITLNNLTISAGTLTSTSGTMSLAGNFSNSGTFTHNNGTVTLNGTSAQTISGSSVTTFNNLTLNNNAGFSLSNSITVIGICTLTNGALSVGANTLTFQTSNTPIVKTSGTITTSTSSNLFFGTSGNTAGAAFVIPNGTFTTAPSINNFTINRTNSLTLNDQMMSLSGILLCNGPLTTNGNLTLLSTAAQTALIDGSSNGQVSGNVTMQRYLPSGFGYKYISSPFQASTVNEFSNDLDLTASFPTFYKYDESKASSGWVSYVTSTNLLNPMQGYAANFGSSASAKTVDVTGVVNNGILSIILYNNNQPYTLGFNLVGNPYPSPIDWNAASGWTKTNIDNALYYFNAGITDQYTGTYSTYINGVSSDGLATNIIPSMQGFFVHVTDGSFPVTGNLGVTNNVRINDLTHAFLKSARTNALPLLRITAGFVDNGTPSDPTVIYFASAATQLFDKDFDALKLMNTDTLVPNIYSMTPDTKRLSINAIPFPIDSLDSITLGIRTAKDGWITFKASDIEQIPTGMHIYLVDAGAGVNQDLKLNPQYRFFLNAGEYETRFSLVFSSTVVTATSKKDIPTEFSLSQNYPNPFNPRTTIKYSIPQTNFVSITVYDLLGKEVSKLVNEEKLSGSYEVQFDASKLPSGVYFYSLHAGKFIETKKIMLLK